MPQFHEFPVEDKNSWEQHKTRLNPEDPRRYPKEWKKDGYIQIFDEYDRGSTLLGITGFYGFGTEVMGIPNLSLGFYKDSELVENMAAHWEYFMIEAIRKAVEALKDRIDLVFWW